MVRSKQPPKHESRSGGFKNQRRNSNDNAESSSSKGPVVVDADHSSAKSTDYNQFRNINEQLGSIGLSIRKVIGDGNCLFRALCDQMEGNPRNHFRLRATLVDYMRSHRADFEPFFDPELQDEDGNTQPTFDAYLNRLSKAGTYGGNDMLVAMARLHNVCVVVHQYLEKPWHIEPPPPDDLFGAAAAAAAAPVRRQIHLFYHTNGDHYDSVRMRGDNSNAPTQIMMQLKIDQNEQRGGKQRKKGKKTASAAASQAYDYSSVSPEEDEAIAAAIAASTATAAAAAEPSFEDVASSACIEELVERVANEAGVPPEDTARRLRIEQLLIEMDLDADAVLQYLLSNFELELNSATALAPKAESSSKCPLPPGTVSTASALVANSQNDPKKKAISSSPTTAESSTSTSLVSSSAPKAAQPSCLTCPARSERTPPRLTDADTCLTPDNPSTSTSASTCIVNASEESLCVPSTTCSPPAPHAMTSSLLQSDAAASLAPTEGAAVAAAGAGAAASCETDDESNGSGSDEENDKGESATATATATATAGGISASTSNSNAHENENTKKTKKKAQRPSASQVKRGKKAEKKARAAQRRQEQHMTANQTAAAVAAPGVDENLQILIRTTALVRV